MTGSVPQNPVSNCPFLSKGHIHMNSVERGPGPLKPENARAMRELMLPPATPILIGDVYTKLVPGVTPDDFDNGVRTMVASAFAADAVYVGANTLDAPMTAAFFRDTALLAPDRTAVILPGDGAVRLAEENPALREAVSRFCLFPAKAGRTVDNGTVSSVAVTLPDTLTDGLRSGKFRDVMVIDDAVATGATLRTIAGKLPPESRTGVRLSGYTWFLRSDAECGPFTALTACYRYGASAGYPPLNSLSTWLRGDGKSAAVLSRYTQKYIRYPYGFRKALETLKEMVNL
jgi:hypothetical protein